MMAASESIRASDALARDVKAIIDDAPIAHLSIPEFDALVGGVRPGKITIIGGEPATGKTTLCDQVKTELAAQGVFTIYATYEPSTHELTAKSLARLSGGTLGLSKLRAAAVSSTPEFNEAFFTYREIADRIAYIEDSPNILSLSSVVGKARQNHPQSPIALILDYIQLVPSQIRRPIDERSRMQEVTSGLRHIAVKYQVSIFAISALTRSSYGKQKELDALSGSQTIEYSADTVITLSLDGKGEERHKNAEKPMRPVTATSLKCRHGAVGSAKLDFDTEFARFVSRVDEMKRTR